MLLVSTEKEQSRCALFSRFIFVHRYRLSDPVSCVLRRCTLIHQFRRPLHVGCLEPCDERLGYEVLIQRILPVAVKCIVPQRDGCTAALCEHAHVRAVLLNMSDVASCCGESNAAERTDG